MQSCLYFTVSNFISRPTTLTDKHQIAPQQRQPYFPESKLTFILLGLILIFEKEALSLSKVPRNLVPYLTGVNLQGKEQVLNSNSCYA